MPVRKLTEKEELLESDRICSIAFAGSWSREEAIKALEAPSSPPPVSFGYFNQEGALTASMVLPEYQALIRLCWRPAFTYRIFKRTH